MDDKRCIPMKNMIIDLHRHTCKGRFIERIIFRRYDKYHNFRIYEIVKKKYIIIKIKRIRRKFKYFLHALKISRDIFKFFHDPPTTMAHIIYRSLGTPRSFTQGKDTQGYQDARP